MSETVVVRGAGGSTFVVDVPARGHARERWDEQIAKGDIVIVGPADPEPEATPAPELAADEVPEVVSPRRGRPPKLQE